MEENSKKPKIVVATHDAKFHADECMAIAILNLVYGEQNIEIYRTRKIEIIELADFKIDVGNKYDPDNNYFDHHQENAPMRNNGIKYAAAGMLWSYYGRKVLKDYEIEDCHIETAFARIENGIIIPIDLHDNGHSECHKHVFGFSTFISNINPNWDEDDHPDNWFDIAVRTCQLALIKRIKSIRSQLKAINIVKEASENSNNKILILEQSVPWSRTLFESEYHEYFDFVISPDINAGDWKVMCIPEQPFGFEVKKRLPESWSGKNGKQFIKITGVKDAIFCHQERFIASAASKKGAIKLAELAIQG